MVNSGACPSHRCPSQEVPPQDNSPDPSPSNAQPQAGNDSPQDDSPESQESVNIGTVRHMLSDMERAVARADSAAQHIGEMRTQLEFMLRHKVPTQADNVPPQADNVPQAAASHSEPAGRVTAGSSYSEPAGLYSMALEPEYRGIQSDLDGYTLHKMDYVEQPQRGARAI